jgi:serine/threonine-protein kinase
MQKIGRYEIVEELGRGSMGAVFKARDPQINRTVAIKIILTANLPREENDLYRARFYREAQAAGQMAHPGIVTIHDIAEDENGQPFLVMEYVEGQNLHKLLRPNNVGKICERLPLHRVLDLCAQVADALDYAHARGVVHRDVKPSNIIVTAAGRAKIADFGIARYSGTEATHTTTVQGTPAYMSPEQFRGGIIDKRSDIFSLGAMLYWMTTGEKPFPGDSVTQVSFNVVYREPAPPRQIVPGLPKDLEVVLSRCLAKRPEQRYAAAGEVAADLRAIAAGQAVEATQAPAEATVEDTVVTMAEVTPVGVPLDHTDRPVGLKRPSILSAVMTLVAVAVLAVSSWLWKRSSGTPAPPAASTDAAPKPADTAASAVSPPPPPSVTPVQKTEAKASSPVSPAPEPVSPGADSSKSAKKPSEAVAAATFSIDCKHGFKEATLEILAGGRTLFSGKLTGKPGLFGRTSGSLAEKVALRPGAHSLVVKVRSAEKNYIDEEKIEGLFTADKPQTLEIRFARNNNLTLKWKK